MSLVATVEALVDAGATPQMILAVVRAHVASSEADLAKRRENDAARQRAKRERDAHVMSRDVTVTVDEAVTPPAPPSSLPPRPPNPTTPTPPDITTRSRKDLRIPKPNGFAKWWEAYPNKTGKGAAEKSYEKACRVIGGHDPPVVLLDGLERAKRSRKWLEGYIPNPATWLNQERWNDEPPEIEPRKPHDQSGSDQQSTPRQESLRAMHAGAMAALDRRAASVG